MKRFKILLVSLLFFSILSQGGEKTSKSEQKPNILFIMSDDHTSQAVGAYGGRLASLNPTPTIDKIATEGMLFENAFCTNSICTPSRASIITGQHSHVNGCLTLYEGLPKEKQYLPTLFKQAGYQTAIVGKWHLSESPEAFDYYNVLPAQGKYMDPILYTREGGKKELVKFSSKLSREINITHYKGHSTDVITDLSLKWLKEGRDKTKPFFMMLHFKAPHDMFENAPRYDTYLEDVTIPEPASLYDDKNHGSIATKGFNNELEGYIGTSIGTRHQRRNYVMNFVDRELKTAGDSIKSLAYQIYLKKYLRCVKGVDDNLARVVEYLKKEGLYDNTVIVYTGDQGMWLGEHDYQDKRWAYEESLRMPFIVRYPKTVKAGGRTNALIENIDYGPTILDFAGVNTPKYMQGKSFKQILESGSEPNDWKQETYYQYWMHMAHHYNPAHFAIRTKEYKLIFFYGHRNDSFFPQTPPGWELYDLMKDPKEMNNVYDDPAYQLVAKQLKAKLKKLRATIEVDQPKKEYGSFVNDEIKVVNEIVGEFWDYDQDDRRKAIEISNGFVKKYDKLFRH